MMQQELTSSPSTSSFIPRCALGGIFVQKQRWGLSLKGWIVMMGLGVFLFVSVALTIHPFLAQNKPVSTQTLVVEAWLPEYALNEAGKIYKAGGYNHLFLTGGPFKGGVEMDADDTYPHRAQKYFKKIGLTNTMSITYYQVKRDRTYTSALAFKNHVEEQNLPITGFNVVTLGPHARRSRSSFQKAFGKSLNVGVIALPNREYDSSQWWRYSEGVKEVINEGIAYVYSFLQLRSSKDKTLSPPPA